MEPVDRTVVIPLMVIAYAIAIPILICALRYIWKITKTLPGHCPICHEPGPETGHEECIASWSIK